MKRFSFSDDDLRRAATRVEEIMLKRYESLYDDTYTFSDEFNEKMEKLIRSVKRRAKIVTLAKRTAAVFAALLVGFGAWLTFDVDARAAVFDWVKEVYEDFVAYKYWGKSKPKALPAYELTWLPEGFVEVDGADGEGFRLTVYMNIETGNFILFEYRFNVDTYVGIQESTNNAPYEKIEIQGNSADFYCADESSDTNTLIWRNQSTNVTFLINSTLNQNDIIQIAESISLIEL